MSPLAATLVQVAVAAWFVGTFLLLGRAALLAHRSGMARVRAAVAAERLQLDPAELQRREAARLERLETWGAWCNVRRGSHRAGRSWATLPGDDGDA